MERVRVGIATIQNRADVLEKAVESLYHQADEICVNLNGWDHIPAFLKRRKIITNQTDNLGDLQKFIFLDGFDGYYFTCDDDIVYGPGYVETMLDGIERYGRQAAVGWHGSILKEPFEDYYSRDSRDVFTFRSRIKQDRQMDVLGTGCTGFHTDTIRPPMSIFRRPSMSDVWFAKYAREQGVPLMLLAHDANVLTPMKTSGSISDDSIARKRSALDVRDRVNALTKEMLKVPAVEFNPAGEPPTAHVCIVGRTDHARWLKGGIRKSAVMMEEMIRDIGFTCELQEIDSPVAELEKAVVTSAADVVLMYTGDQGAQDFYAVHPVVTAALDAGKAVLVNASIDAHPDRNAQVIEFLNQHRNHPRLYVMTFAQSTEQLAAFSAIRDRLVVVPKTLEYMVPPRAVPFATRGGIFLGDLGKLCNPRLAPDALDYLRAVKDVLPGVELTCVSQYAAKNVNPAIRELVDVIPFQENISAAMSGFRLYLHLFNHCTFEMLPTEAMSTGLPVLYRDMPHSLNEYVGLNGLRFGTVDELSQIVSYAYNSEPVWRQLSRGGRLRGAANDARYLGAAFGAALLRCAASSQKG